MKTLSILILLGLISGCNEKEKEIIELEPPVMAVQEEVEQVAEVIEPEPIVKPEPIEEVSEVVEKIEVVEIVEETQEVKETKEIEGGAI